MLDFYSLPNYIILKYEIKTSSIMKKVMPYSAMFVCVIAIFISGCKHSKPSEVIVKDALGFYHIDGKPEIA